jgi:hypothetical protein
MGYRAVSFSSQTPLRSIPPPETAPVTYGFYIYFNIIYMRRMSLTIFFHNILNSFLFCAAIKDGATVPFIFF